jgi:glucose-6-phosphate isomerase
LAYNLTGYESETVYPYSTGPNISMQAKNQLKMQSKVEPITP